MDLSVVCSLNTMPSGSALSSFLLIGQRSTSGSDSSRERTLCIVLDAFPCTDEDVVAEQVDCLDSVLPCGLSFLGLLVPSDKTDLSQLKHSLKDHPSALSLVTLVCADGRVSSCRLLHTDRSVPFTSPTAKPFVRTVACCLHAPFGALPLVVRPMGGEDTSHTVLDLHSHAPLGAGTLWEAEEDLYALQLGFREDQKSSALFWLHVTFVPLYTCGCDIFNSISSFLLRLESHPDGRIARVQSQRNPELIFQWPFTVVAGNKDGLSKTQWGELKDLIEDGSGEVVRSFQVLSDTPNMAAKKAVMPLASLDTAKHMQPQVTEETKVLHSETKEEEKMEKEEEVLKRVTQPDTRARLIPAVAVALAVALAAILWTHLSA